MKFIPVKGYHAYDEEGNHICTVHVDVQDNFTLDNGEQTMVVASCLEDIVVINGMLEKLIMDMEGRSTPNNLLRLEDT